MPLAGAGFVLALFASAGASRRALLVWSSFVPTYVLAVAVFFVATRYRLPLLVALAPLGGAAVARRTQALRARRGVGSRPRTAAVLAAVSLWPAGLYDGAADEDMHWALYLVEKGDAAEAARVADAAASRHPDPGLMWFRMGQAWAAANRMDDAITSLEKAARSFRTRRRRSGPSRPRTKAGASTASSRTTRRGPCRTSRRRSLFHRTIPACS